MSAHPLIRSRTISTIRAGDLGRRAVQHLGALAALGRSQPAPPRARRGRHRSGVETQLLGRGHLERLLARLLDRPQVRVARLVDPGLDRQQRRRAHAQDLDQAALELALDGRRGLGGVVVELFDHRHVGQPEVARDGHPRGAVDRIGGLHAAQHEVRRLALDRGGEHPRHRERVGVLQRLVPDTRGAIGAPGQAAEQRLLGLLVAHRDHHDFTVAAGLVAQLQRRLERERVPLVEIQLEEVRVDARAVVEQLELVVERRHLLHRDDDLHAGPVPVCLRSWSSG